MTKKKEVKKTGKGPWPIKRGKIYYCFHKYTPDGKLKAISTGCKDIREATKWCDEYIQILLISALPQGVDISKEIDVILDELEPFRQKYINPIADDIETYFTNNDNDYSIQDIQKRKYVINSFKAYLEKKSVNEWHNITISMIDNFLNSFKITPMTKYSYSIVVKALYTWLIKKKKASTCPFNLTRYSLSKKEMKLYQKNPIVPLTDSEITTIETIITNARDKMVYLIGIHTGMRISEIMHLLWKNIDFDNKLVYVRPNTETKDVAKSRLKTDNSIREIPLKSVLANALLIYRTQSKSDYVIEHKGNRRQYKWTSKKKIESIRSDFHSHLMRHTYITRALTVGKHSIFLVAKWAGDSPKMITTVYGHFYNTGDVDNF